jgi:predicted nuclease of predicted toxin-antitoxin system
MNLLADEGVDRPIVERLRQDGHDVLYVAEMEPSIDDDIVLDRANQHQAVLVTADKDFGELVYRLGRIHRGVILIRLEGLQPSTKASVVAMALREHGDKVLDAFSVITPGLVRIRSQQR